MAIHLNEEQQFLCCAVADDVTWHQNDLRRLWQQVGDKRAFAIAKKNKSAAIVARALHNVLSEDVLSVQWSEAATEIASKLSLYMNELDRVASALAKEHIPLIALKNAGIARGIYSDLAGNPMGDVDVLVRYQDFRRAHHVMLSLGYCLGSRSPLAVNTLEEAEQSGGSEYTLTLSDGSTLWFELQWRPIAGRWINERQEPAADDLVARSIPIANSDVRLLSPNDNLLQVCLHTAKHSYVRAPGFRLHTDVDRIVRRCEINWDVFVQQVQQLQVCTAVYFSLWLAKELLHTPIPAPVLKQLCPVWWRRMAVWSLLLRAGLFNPDDRKWNRVEYLLFNMFLYDSVTSIIRSIFPSVAYMRQNHGLTHIWSLPMVYLRRMGHLLFKRART